MYPNIWMQWTTEFTEYWLDTVQRQVLFWDVLRKRGNDYLDHLGKDQPPVLVFEYETVLDGRTLERPVNFSLVRILDRRSEKDRRRAEADVSRAGDRRGEATRHRHKPKVAYEAPLDTKRPIIIFDPRAGHGPGIGGSKQESQIGMALDAGHPVYFLIFSTYPVPGQTLADVHNAQIRFTEKVGELHPDAGRPAIIGNCQGGWAAALVGAERPDLVGPMAFNGSPLSYWAGIKGVNPLRYQGGLLGGVWLTSLMSDLGHGYFDGAHLVANFESLNPGNTLWAKNYHLYANVDTEEKRFIDFERWWGGFFLMTDEEIHEIVEGLFIGNKLERGEFQLVEDRYVELKNNHNPVILFASFGDNITPPQQAFNWIVKAYGTVDEIRRRGQVVVYLLHSGIGHLGIFVSAKIARKEHKEIIASFNMLYHLDPGLYEMRIDEDPDQPGEYVVHYTAKEMGDILAMDDGMADEEAFLAVRRVSEVFDFCYRTMISPWIRLTNNDLIAETIRRLHPLRVQRVFFSDANPWMSIVNFQAHQIKDLELRSPAANTNRFRLQEKNLSDMIVHALNLYQTTRDSASELIFKAMYENPMMEMLADISGTHPRTKRQVKQAWQHIPADHQGAGSTGS